MLTQFLGDDLPSFKQGSDEEKKALFEKKIKNKNITLETPEKISIAPSVFAGILAGTFIFYLSKKRYTK